MAPWVESVGRWVDGSDGSMGRWVYGDILVHLWCFGNGALRRALKVYFCIFIGFGNGALRLALEVCLCISMAFGNRDLRRALESKSVVVLWPLLAASYWLLGRFGAWVHLANG